MKRLFIIAVLAFAVLPAFSQEDEYARFQGVWYGEREDENPYFVFENNTVIMFDSSNGGVFFCNFTLSSHKIIFYIKRIFKFIDDSKWQSATPDDMDEEGFEKIFEMDYVFSGNKLILVSGSHPLVLQKMD